MYISKDSRPLNLTTIRDMIKAGSTTTYDNYDLSIYDKPIFTIDGPVGIQENPIATVNFYAVQAGWVDGEHATFKDAPYPLIWNWWQRFIVNASGTPIGVEK